MLSSYQVIRPGGTIRARPAATLTAERHLCLKVAADADRSRRDYLRQNLPEQHEYEKAGDTILHNELNYHDP
jgi:hypothetical protein